MEIATHDREERQNGTDGRQVHPEQGGWLTAEQAAHYAGQVGVSTVREACNRRELRHIRVGGRPRGPIRTRREWVDEWLERWARGGEMA